MKLFFCAFSITIFSCFFSSEAAQQACFDRKTSSHLLKVDTHIHSQPFGRRALPFSELSSILKESGVTFATAYGIGQLFGVKTECKHYTECPETPIYPTWINDFRNARELQRNPDKDTIITLSFSFPDLANPENVLNKLKYIENEHPKMFKWVGEVNLINHAVISNAHEPATRKDINNWQAFMAYLADNRIPITIHSDLGLNNDPFKNVHLI